MLRLGDLDIRGARRHEAQEVGRVFGVEELRPRAADERERRARGRDERSRVDAG